MRKLKIAHGNSRTSTKWSNKSVSFDELCEQFETPVRTSETAEEYTKLPKAERDRIKDIGGIVAAELKGGRRKRENVNCCSMVKLDGDKINVGFIDAFESTNRHAAVLYSTHSHTPDEPRLRVFIPLTRDVSPDELNAITRYIADDLGIDQFDECSYLPHQLMYRPSCPTNAEYIYKKYEGEWLNPDELLAMHPNWQDISTLPTSSRESAALRHSLKHQADPLSKGGVVGAFCRTYSIGEAIDVFLSDVYEPSMTVGRYDYIPADSSAGVVVYDDKFAFSHHASDPACERLLNAFDLVKTHKFSDLDDKAAFRAMCEFALSLDRVKIQIDEERKVEALSDFNTEGKDWRTLLKYMPKSNVLENSVWNEMLILNNDPDFAHFAFNELANRVQVTGELPWGRPINNRFWRDADTAQMKALIDVRYVSFSSRNHDVSFTKVADDRRFHPIREYLNGLPAWDGVPRIETLLVRCLQADDTPYVRAVTRKTFAAAIARIFQPGTKFDSVLVFDGVQGIGKSTFFKDLVGEEYYSETLSLTDMDDKSGAEKLQGFWVVEIGELAGMKKADVEKVKAFLSTSDDKYRPSYGKTVESHPRQCIIIASVNGERGYLRDITGNRRFWIVKVHQEEQVKRWNFSAEERDQIWAEAKAIYESGEKLYLEGDLIKTSEAAQRDAMEVDERQGIVEEYLNTPLPENWDAMDFYQRRNFISDKSDPTHPKGIRKRIEVSNVEIWCECLGRNMADLKPVDSYALAALMTKINGWERTKDMKRLAVYGRQRLYRRTCSDD